MSVQRALMRLQWPFVAGPRCSVPLGLGHHLLYSLGVFLCLSKAPSVVVVVATQYCSVQRVTIGHLNLELHRCFASFSSWCLCRAKLRVAHVFALIRFYSTPDGPGSNTSTRSGVEQCRAGEYCLAGARAVCPAGRYSGSFGATSCDVCPAGTLFVTHLRPQYGRTSGAVLFHLLCNILPCLWLQVSFVATERACLVYPTRASSPPLSVRKDLPPSCQHPAAPLLSLPPLACFSIPPCVQLVNSARAALRSLAPWAPTAHDVGRPPAAALGLAAPGIGAAPALPHPPLRPARLGLRVTALRWGVIGLFWRPRSIR
jgi:hypothetical protein